MNTHSSPQLTGSMADRDAVERQGVLARVAISFAAWAERWFPDAFVFVAIAVSVVSLAALINGASPQSVAKAFGDGFWSLIAFTMQMAFVAIGGYVVATAPVVHRLIERLARVPGTARGAVGFVAALTMLISFVNWGVGLMFGALLARALARRTSLRMDYRAAGAAAYLGLGATWALGLSSSAAQLQANPASLPKSLLAITGVIPFEQTIFLWQSMLLAGILLVVSVLVAMWSTPSGDHAQTAQAMGLDVFADDAPVAKAVNPGEWLECSPILALILAALGFGWLAQEFAAKGLLTAISNLNTYNLLFLTLGVLLQGTPRRFLSAVARSIPATGSILIQFPLYGATAAIMVSAKNGAGVSIADQVAHFFVSFNTQNTFPITMGIYSAVLGFFVPSGGGKWLLEAPYVMQAANELKVHLGWAVQVYNAAEALPNLVNPFWMLPLLGVLGLKARDIVGFTAIQLIIHTPLVLILLWLLAETLIYIPPVMPS